MKRRRILVVALLILAVTASAAYAAGLAPKTGSWRGAAGDSEEAVAFKLVKVGDGYRATSTRAVVIAPCKAPNPNDSTSVRVMRARRMSVNLGPSGKQLLGTRKLASTRGGGKATETVSIAMRFTSARRAKVVVKAAYVTKRPNPQSNSDTCAGRLAVIAKPQ